MERRLYQIWRWWYRNRNLSIKEYLDKIKPYLKDIIKDIQISDTWKIKLTIVIHFISFKDIDKQHVMHLESHNTEVMAYDKAEEFIKELFESLLSKHQIGLKTSIKAVVLSLIFYLLHCKWHKVNVKRGGSYIGLPDWIKSKKAAISPINKNDNKYIKYSRTKFWKNWKKSWKNNRS